MLTGRLQPATTLSGRYRVVRKLGQGGMGAVYLADDTRLPGKQWAIKEMSDAAIADVAERSQALQAFQQEAQMLATLDHPNLPKVVDYFSENGNQYLAMEYVSGDTIEQIIERSHGPLSEAQVIPWADQLCDALKYLHSLHPPIVFRDLKPGNIMIQPDGRVKLIDFGIARHFKQGQNKDTQAFGTPGYAPPEQHGKGQTDARSDIYSLGATLHQLVTGQDPNLSPFHFEPVKKLNPAVSGELADVITKAVELRPERRWQTTSDLQKVLRASTGSLTSGGHTVINVPATAAVAGRAANPAAPLAATQVVSPVVQPAPFVDPLAVAGFPPYAGWWRRFGASLLDSFVSLVILFIFAFWEDAAGGDGAIIVLGSLLTLIFYYIRPTAVSGQTWGKKAMKIQVVNKKGGPPGWGRSFLRYLIGFPIEVLLSYVLIGLLGLLWPIWDKQKQAWHDKIAGTFVIDG